MRHPTIWRLCPEYRKYLNQAIELFPSFIGHVNVERILLVAFFRKSSKHVAQIIRNIEPWSLVLPQFDYCIQFWDTRYEAYTQPYRIFVALHELLHIPEGGFDPDHRLYYRTLTEHDIEDFKILRRAYGINLQRVEDVMLGEAGLLKGKRIHDVGSDIPLG